MGPGHARPQAKDQGLQARRTAQQQPGHLSRTSTAHLGSTSPSDQRANSHYHPEEQGFQLKQLLHMMILCATFIATVNTGVLARVSNLKVGPGVLKLQLISPLDRSIPL